jgi:hypothetical protein
MGYNVPEDGAGGVPGTAAGGAFVVKMGLWKGRFIRLSN